MAFCQSSLPSSNCSFNNLILASLRTSLLVIIIIIIIPFIVLYKSKTIIGQLGYSGLVYQVVGLVYCYKSQKE